MKADLEKNSIDLNFIQNFVSDKEDKVNDLYEIHLNEEISALSNDFCKYYNASNIETREKYFAIIFEPSYVVPIKTIDFLLKYKVNGLNSIISRAVVKISLNNLERLVLIVNHYDYTDNLLSYIQKHGSISAMRVEGLIKKLNLVLTNLSSNKIYGYNVTPSNILMKEGEFLSLREFIVSYPYFYVQDPYIAPELLQCMKAGRRVSCVKADMYATGVSMFQAYSGKNDFFNPVNVEEYNTNRLEQTTYKFLVYKIRISEKLRNFFRFTMHDEAIVRWNPNNIATWLESKSEHILHDPIGDNKYMIGFNDRNYSNMKSLAHAIFESWEAAGKFIRDNKLFKWAERQKINSDMLEGIKQIVDNGIQEGYPVSLSNPLNINQKISKLLSVIDPQGPIRQENIAFAAASLPEAVQYAYNLKRKNEVERLIKIAKDELWKQYVNDEAAGFLETSQGDYFRHLVSNVNFISPYKSIERFIYALNPYLPCLSPFLNGKYVTDIKSLLNALESYALKNPKNFLIDRHIIGFLSAKLDLKEAIGPAILSNFPTVGDHPAIKALSILNILQQHVSDIKLPGISKSLTLDLQTIFKDHLHNIDFKKEVINKLADTGSRGELSEIIKLLSDQQAFVNDYNGYHDAYKKVKNLEAGINNLSNQEIINSGTLIWGQKMTVLASYILCLLVIVTLIR